MKPWISVFLDEQVNYSINAQAYLAPLKAMADAHLKYSDTVDKSVTQTKKMTKAGLEFTATVKKAITPTKEFAQTVKIAADNEVTWSNTTKDTTAALIAKEAALKRVVAQQKAATAEANKGIRAQFGFSGKKALASGATPDEVINFKQQQLALRNLAAEANLTKEGFRKFYASVIDGSVRVTAGNQRLINQIRATEIAYRSVGATAKKAAFSQLEASRKLRVANVVAAREATKARQAQFRGFVKAAQATKKQTEATKDAEKASKGLLISWESFARLIAVQVIHRAISAIAVGIREGVRTATDLAVKIAEIQTISQNVPLSFGAWADGLERLSSSFGFSILDSAEAAYQALSNQIAEGAETLTFLNSASRLAVATVSDQSVAVLALTGVLNAYNLEAIYADEVSAALFKTVELGRLRLSDIGQSIGDVAVLASQLNISYQELFATIDTLTIQGIAFNKAQTQLRGFFTKLLKPTTELKDLFIEMGVSSGEQAIEIFGLTGVLKTLQDRTQGSSTELAKYINRIRGITAALVLTGDGFETFRSNLKETQDSTESFDRAVQTVLDNQGKKVQITTQNLKNFFTVEIGQNLVRSLAVLSDHIGGLLEAFRIAMRGIRIVVTAVLFVLMKKAAKNVQKQFLAMAAAFKTARDAAISFGASLKKALLSSPLVILVALQAVLELIIFLHERSVRQAEEQRRNWEEVWDTYAVEAQKAVNKSVDFIVEGNRILANLTIQQAARVSGNISKFAVDTGKMIEEASKSLKKAHAADLKILNEGIKELEATFKKAQSTFEDALDALAALDEATAKGIFDIRLGQAEDPREKKELIKERTAALKVQLQEATTVERVKKLNQEILALVEKRVDISKESSKTNEDNAEERIKLQKKLRGLFITAEKKEQALFRKTTKRETGKNPNIESEIAVIKLEKAKILSQIRTTKAELEAIKNIYVDKINHEKAFRAVQKETRKQLTRLEDAAAKKREDAAAALEAQTNKKIALEKAFADFQKSQGAVGKITVSTDEKEIRETAKIALDAINNLRKAKRDLNQTDIEDVVKLVEMEKRLRTVAEGRISQVVLERQREEAEDAKKNLEERAEQVKATVAGMIRTIKTLAPEYLALLDELPEGIPDSIRDSLESPEMKEELAKIKESLGDAFPTEKFEDVVASYNAQLATLKQFEEDLKANEKLLEVIRAKQAGPATKVERFEESVSEASKAIDRLTRAVAGLEGALAAPRPTVQGGESALGGLIQTFANGNKVQVGSDTVPAMLSPGEFVMNKGATRQFYSQLVAMNSGVSRFADGGSTSNTFGDFNISMESSGNESIDVIRLGKSLRREIRRGTITLSR